MTGADMFARGARPDGRLLAGLADEAAAARPRLGVAEGDSFDLLVVGAGGAGLATALFAALDGAEVLVGVERTGLAAGGTTAWSAGTTWVPATRTALGSTRPTRWPLPKLYLDQAVRRTQPARAAPACWTMAVRPSRRWRPAPEVRYRPDPKHPDYISELTGSTLCGRALEPLPFDGAAVGGTF